MQKAISIIHAEHRSIASVLASLKALVRMARESPARPRFEVFRAMIFFIDAYPETLHHPKEDAWLFGRLMQRRPQARELIETLKDEHVRGAGLVRELERALLEYEAAWPAGAEQAAAAVESYAQFHWDHMRKEETELIPLAERFLTDADWRAIEAAFAGNDDPIADLREKDFDKLYQRILNLAPAPIGLGGGWTGES